MHWRKGSAFAIALTALLLLTVPFGGPLWAQGTTASIGGTVRDARGPLPAATVTAKNAQTAFVYRTVAGDDGSFLLGGLPPGTYEITVYSEAYKEKTVTVTVLLGQANKVNFELSPEKVFVADVSVVGETSKVLVDTRSSVVATNITPEQMETLPINNRNFLAFASLAPGITFTYNTDAEGQYFGSAGAKPEAVNVYIDGTDYKNNLIKGGAFMQDSSRGNPFPQSAVQEYQVMTQNYKAEYGSASAAVITAVTKTGGNVFHGDAFYLYQNKSMVAQDDFAAARGDEKPPYTRKQFGLTLGGPIQKDKLNFFVSYEGTKRDVVSSVFHGGNWSQAPANVISVLSPYPTGAVTSPMTSNLFFGKVSWQPDTAQTVDLSYNRRDENDLKGFGGQTEASAGSQYEIKTDSALLRHQWIINNNSLNEGSLTFQTQEWIQGAAASNAPFLNYSGLLNVGGATFRQDFKQTKTSLRDDYSYFTEWHGEHTVKAGLLVNFMKYDATHAAFFNPEFDFSPDQNWQYPFKAWYGSGNPVNKYDNDQYGLYVQDDWRAASNLTINAGLRWDYETNGLNNKWVTPASVVSALQNTCRTFSQPVGGKTTWCDTDLFNINDYISTGNNRKPYSKEFQPRLGFSWDVNGNGRSVVFGGWGLFYDRVPLNDMYDEEWKNTWGQYVFCFTNDPAQVGTINNSCSSVPQILWNPSYQSAAGLAGLIQSGAVQGHEINLLANNTHVPRSMQWNIGARQQFGNWIGSLTYSNVRGSNGMVWSFGTLPPGTTFAQRWGNSVGLNGFGFVMRSYDTRTSSYDGVMLTLDKPYTRDSNWGFDFAYTYSDAKQSASTDDGVAFAFDSLPPDFSTFRNIQAEKHKIIMNGTVGLGAGFTVSSIITLSSGLPLYVFDCRTAGGCDAAIPSAFDPPKQSFLGIKQFAYRSVDLRAEWDPEVGGGFHLGIIGEAFNVFNFSNNSGFDTWAGDLANPNPNFLKPSSQINTRRFQVGLKVSF